MSTDTSAMPVRGFFATHQLAAYRSILEERWRHQVNDIVDLSYDALSASADGVDEGFSATEQLLSSRLLAAARQQLQETEAALRRLDKGTYGVCRSCGDRISTERLEILPAAVSCVACRSGSRARKP